MEIGSKAFTAMTNRHPADEMADIREQIKVLKAAGLNIAWHEFNKAHNIAGEPEVKLIRDFIAAGYQKQA